MSSRFDVLVVGAGPAGIAAAVTAAETGARVALLDERPQVGGQIWQVDRGTMSARARVWICRLQQAGVLPWPATSVSDASTDEATGVRLHTNRGLLLGRKVILACGARELFLPFPGWTLPGVTGAGGLQALVHDGLDVSGQRIVVAGSGPLLLQVAAFLRARRARVIRIAEQTTGTRLLRFGLSLRADKLRQAASLWSPRLRTSQWVTAVHGQEQVESISLRSRGGHETIACDRLAVGFSLVPNLELPRLFGCRVQPSGVVVDERQATSVAHVHAAGEVCGVKGVAGALAEGICAGAAVCDQEPPPAALRQRHRERRFADSLAAAFALRSELLQLAEAATLVCRCEDVPYGDLRGFSDWTSAKLQSRCGMGACQGRICGAATRHLFGWGPEGVRPPLVPVPVAALMNEGSSS